MTLETINNTLTLEEQIKAKIEYCNNIALDITVLLNKFAKFKSENYLFDAQLYTKHLETSLDTLKRMIYSKKHIKH